VIVLDERSGAQTLWPELIDQMARDRRVLIPEVPSAEPRFTAWLRGFIDGMGLPPITLVAVGDLCLSSIEFTLLEPERIERLILVPSGRVEETGLSGALSSTLGSADVEMLVVRRDFPSTEAISIIERFLRGERA
jgi:pimeloyl-ACP methyl ester carboxylesterase